MLSLIIWRSLSPNSQEIVGGCQAGFVDDRSTFVPSAQYCPGRRNMASRTQLLGHDFHGIRSIRLLYGWHGHYCQDIWNGCRSEMWSWVFPAVTWPLMKCCLMPICLTGSIHPLLIVVSFRSLHFISSYVPASQMLSDPAAHSAKYSVSLADVNVAVVCLRLAQEIGHPQTFNMWA